MTTPQPPDPDPRPADPAPSDEPVPGPPAPRRPATAVLIAVIAAATLVSVTAIVAITVLILDIRRDGRVGAEPSASPSETPWWASPPSPTPSRFTGCAYRDSDRKPTRPVKPPVFDPAVDGRRMIAEIDTNRGTITIELDGDATPCTVASFRHLAAEKFYDDTRCHRMTTSGLWVLQCGDPSGTGRGGPGYSFADENLSSKVTYDRGVVAMANAGPDTNGSQFFINYKDSPLDPNYTVFGEVTKGMEIVDEVAAGGIRGNNSHGDGPPKRPLVIESIQVRPA